MFSIVPRAGSISQDSTAGQAQTKGPGWHSQPRGAGSRRVIYLISQWHPRNEWCLREMNTAQPTATGKTASRDLADAELGSHGCPESLPARGQHKVGWVLAAFEAPQSKTEQETPKTEHSPSKLTSATPGVAQMRTQSSGFPSFGPSSSSCPGCSGPPPLSQVTTLGFPAALLGNADKQLHFIGFKKRPRLHGYSFTAQLAGTACVSYGPCPQAVLPAEGNKKFWRPRWPL